MRRYSYRCGDGRDVIFGGHFEFEIRGDYALVVLADHLIPLDVSEIPTQIYRHFLCRLNPANILFIEFDAVVHCFRLADLRFVETAGTYCFLGAEPLAEAVVQGLGLNGRWWNQLLAPVVNAARRSQAAA